MNRTLRAKNAWAMAPAAFVPLLALGLTASGSPGGAGQSTQIPAYYDGKLIRINILELPNSDPLIQNNKSINTIYVTNDLDEEQDFAPVVDAIQGDGFNPIWRQVFIVFNDPMAAHQFVSDEEVLDAAEVGEITLMPSDEVYICAIVGPKK